MKTKFLIALYLISLGCFSQKWFDNTCNNIEDKISTQTYKNTADKNKLKILINQAEEVLINDKVFKDFGEIAFKEYVLDFVTNPSKDKKKAESPEKVVINLKSFDKNSAFLTSVRTYLQDVYLYLWDKSAEEKYNSTYIDLNCKKRLKIFNNYPLNIFEESQVSTTRHNKPKALSVPHFGGDALD